MTTNNAFYTNKKLPMKIDESIIRPIIMYSYGAEEMTTRKMKNSSKHKRKNIMVYIYKPEKIAKHELK